MQMTEPMNEERANQMLTDAMGYDATDLARALGYLERVEQEKTIIDSFKQEHALNWKRMNKYRKAIEAADRMGKEIGTDDLVFDLGLKKAALAFRAARAKIYPDIAGSGYIPAEPKPIRESVCIRCFKPFDSTAYNNLVNRVCQVCTKKLDKGEPGK
jgi:hypothetical protein